MKYFIKLLPLLSLASIFGQASAAIIEPSINLSTPTLVNTVVDVEADFGTSGENISIQDLLLTINFSQNLFDPGESVQFAYLANINNPPDGITSPAWIADDRIAVLNQSTSTLTWDLSKIHINENGLGLFSLGITGNGASIDSILLTGNATITAVPLPPSLFLFMFALFSLLTPKTLTNHSARTREFP